MIIRRTIDGKVVDIILTENEEKAVYAEGVRQAKIKDAIFMLLSQNNIDISKRELTNEQKDLLVRMDDYYMETYHGYGQKLSWSTTFDAFRQEFFGVFGSIEDRRETSLSASH